MSGWQRARASFGLAEAVAGCSAGKCFPIFPRGLLFHGPTVVELFMTGAPGRRLPGLGAAPSAAQLSW